MEGLVLVAWAAPMRSSKRLQDFSLKHTSPKTHRAKTVLGNGE